MNGLLRGLTPDELGIRRPAGVHEVGAARAGHPEAPGRRHRRRGVLQDAGRSSRRPNARRRSRRRCFAATSPTSCARSTTITVKAKDAAGKEHTAAFEVMPDYLAVGSDADFVRVPMTPQTAARIADAFGCALPTRKMVDDVYRAATVKLEPKPLTEDREASATFLQHNAHHRRTAGRQEARRARRGDQEGRGGDEPAGGEAEPRRDLRLAQARRQTDPAADDRPRATGTSITATACG